MGYWECPRCSLELTAESVVGVELRSCARCGGIMIEHAALNRAIAEPDLWSDLIARAKELDGGAQAEVDGRRLVYLHCPACSGPTARRNFERVSGVMVDACVTHGTWFDQRELVAALEFLRNGGKPKTEQFEKAEAEHEKEQRRVIREIEKHTTQFRGSYWRWRP